MKLKHLFVATLAVLLVAQISVAPAAAAGPPLDYTDERTPDPYIHEDTLTVAEHDRGEMSSLLEYYDDSGNVAELDATVNASQSEPAGVRMDKVESEDFGLFPRVSGEDENSHTWLATGNWSTTSGTNSGMTISDADGNTAGGVDAVEFDASVASTESATANFSDNVSLDEPGKRVLMVVGNVDTIGSSATNVTVRLEDADGDYYYALLNDSVDASEDHVIANSTGNGLFFQEKVNNLPSDTSAGDGTVDSIEHVKIVVDENNAKLTLTGLDVDKKSEYDVAEIEHDRDGDGENETETVTDIYSGGVTEVTGLDTMGSYADSAVINDLEVYDVEYRVSDLSDSDDYSVEFREAEDYGGYDMVLEKHARLTVESAIDLSHGSLELRDDQGLVGERFKVAEYATAQGDTDLDNVSDSDYTDVSSSYSSQGETVTLANSGINPGENLIVHLEVVLQNDEADAMQSQPAAAGPLGGGGGGWLGFLTSPFTLVGGLVGGAAAWYKGWLSWVPYVGGG